ncbi:MAG: hypothetical protein LC102_07145 [Ignavibacteriales bacterium]|nr:MAG: hypothetical protein F9K26_10710 [Ignavibacteriaceae bacterium]MBW7874086.1 hypothetical protein [Ignavibacteria bacterium]MCZ2143186.1 hypothetical protein [Ignavibacteriales bacterium]MBV6444066.1 Chromosome partition protein Smc [Ignavibacteriaceae bacterium]MBZ0196083.1 hypothetical protein [Ignavibacteriaceae bacterium]
MMTPDDSLELKKIELERLRSEELRLVSKIQRLQHNLIDLETKETARLSGFRSTLSKEKDNFNAELLALNKEKEFLENKNRELELKIEANENRLIELAAQQNNKQRLLDSINEYIPNLDGAIIGKERELNSLIEEIELSEQQLNHLNNRLDVVNRDYDLRKKQIVAYENSLVTAQNRLDELDERIKAYEQMKDDLFNEIKVSSGKESGLKENIKRLNEHLSALEKNRLDIESSTISVEDAFIELATAKSEELSELNFKLRSAANELLDQELQLFKNEENIIKKKNSALSLATQSKALEMKVQKSHEELIYLESKKEKLQKEISDISLLKLEMENALSSLNSDLSASEISAFETEKSTVKVIRGLKDEIDTLKNLRDEVRDEYTILEQNLSLLRAELQKSRKAISDIMQENNHLITQKNILNDEITKLIQMKNRLLSELPPFSPDEADYSAASEINKTDFPTDNQFIIQPPADSEDLKTLIRKINESPEEENEN